MIYFRANPLDDSRRFSKLLRCPAEAKEMRKKMDKDYKSMAPCYYVDKTDEVKECA